MRSQQVENDWQQNVVLPQMKERYPQIDLQREIAPPDAQWNEKVFAMHAAGTPPDVHNGTVGTFIQLYAQNKLVELRPLAARDKFDLKAFGGFEKDQDMCRSGKQYGMPILTTLGMMTFYNQALLEQAGVRPPPASWQDRSWTMDTFLDVGRQTTRNAWQPDAVYGAQVFGGNALHAWPYLWGGHPYPKGVLHPGDRPAEQLDRAGAGRGGAVLRRPLAPPPGGAEAGRPNEAVPARAARRCGSTPAGLSRPCGR